MVLGLTATIAAAASGVTTSGSVRLLHDTNLFLQNPVALAPGQTQAGVPSNQDATALDAAFNIGLSWKSSGRVVDLGYSPEIVRYFGHASEDHTDHLLTGNILAGFAEWTLDVKSRYLITNGSDEGPIYNGLGGSPAVGGEPVRSRRSQAIAKANGKLSRQFGERFARVVFSSLDQQFHTREKSTYGYCNYADRDESSIGVDGGQRLWRDLSAVVGGRVGVQRQANVLAVPLNFSNTFVRWLAGIEGSPTRTLKLSILAGPEIHHYGESVRPGFIRQQQTGYGEASATWTPTQQDAIAFSGKRYLWLTGSGRGIYADAIADLSWRHKWSAAWSGSLGTNLHEGDTSHFNAWAPRHDRIYTITAGLSRSFAAQTRVDFDIMHDWGISLVPNSPGREYQRWIVSTGITRTW